MNEIELQQAIRGALSARPEQRAVPALRDIVSSYAAQKSMENERARAATAQLELGKRGLAEEAREKTASLAESARQHETGLAQSRDIYEALRNEAVQEFEKTYAEKGYEHSAKLQEQQEAFKAGIDWASQKFTQLYGEKGRQFGLTTAEQSREFEEKLKESSRQFNLKTEEENRQFMQKLALDRAYLDTWADANKWATVIGIGNLGITGLGMKANLVETAKQQNMLQQILDVTKSNISRYQEGMTSEKERVEDYLNRISGGNRRLPSDDLLASIRS